MWGNTHDSEQDLTVWRTEIYRAPDDLTLVDTLPATPAFESVLSLATQDTAILPAASPKDTVEPSFWEKRSGNKARMTSNLTHVEATATRVAWNSIVQIASKIISLLSGILVLSLTTRILTPNVYGDYVIATVYIGFFGVLADVGVNGITSREAARYPQYLNEVISASLVLKIVFSLFAYGGGSIVVFFLPYSTEVKIATIVLSLAMFIASVGYTGDAAFQAQLQMHIPSLGELIFRVVMLGGTAGLFWYATVTTAPQGTLFYGAVGTLSLAYVAGIVIRLYAIRRLFHFTFSIDVEAWKYLLVMAVPLGVAIVLGQIHYKADAIILSLMQTPRDVAIYGLAYKLIDIMQGFFPVFTGLLFPILGRFEKQDDPGFLRAARGVVNMSLVMIVPCGVGAVLVAPELLDIIGKGRYPESVLPMQILAMASVFSIMSLIHNNITIMQNRQKALMWTMLISVTVNIGFNLYAIPRYSYIGAAIATLLSEGVFMLLSIIVANRGGRMLPSLITLLQVAVACGAMVGGIYLARTYLPVTSTMPRLVELVAIGAVAYGVVLVGIGGVDRSIAGDVFQRVLAKARRH
jgi:O-antigen/teichoic acid export membrane protein